MKGVDVVSVECSMCKKSVETVDHVIFRCNSAIATWRSVAPGVILVIFFLWDVDDLFSDETLEKVPVASRIRWTAMLCSEAWVIWRAQNKLIKEEKKWSILEVVKTNIKS